MVVSSLESSINFVELYHEMFAAGLAPYTWHCSKTFEPSTTCDLTPLKWIRVGRTSRSINSWLEIIGSSSVVFTRHSMMLPSSWRDKLRISLELTLKRPRLSSASTVSCAVNFFPPRYHPRIGWGRAPRTSHESSSRWPSFNGPIVEPFRMRDSSLCVITIADGGTITFTLVCCSPLDASHVSRGSRYVISHEYTSSSSTWIDLIPNRTCFPGT